MAIWISSDYHFNHDREFIWKPRGFSCVKEMNEAIVKRHNAIVMPDDEVYILGDVMLGNEPLVGASLLSLMNGHIHMILGNHDTLNRKKIYESCGIGCCYATMLKYKGYSFYLSHYPTMTSNLEKEHIKQCIINLFGHTHQNSNFYNDIPFMYHVGVDSHHCCPIDLDSIIVEIKDKVKECKDFL